MTIFEGTIIKNAIKKSFSLAFLKKFYTFALVIIISQALVRHE